MNKEAAQPRIIVGVPFYNGARYLETLLASLRYEGAVDVILVDNSPEALALDTLRAAIPTDLSLNVHLVRTAPSIGFGRASNVAQLYAHKLGATHLLLLNQDAALDVNALKAAYNFAETFNFALAGGIEVSEESSEIPAKFREWYTDSIFGDSFKSLDDCRRSDSKSAKFICGSCVLIELETALEHGGFDPVYFMYGEDTELCVRYANLGLPVFILPTMLCYHEHSNFSATGAAHKRVVAWSRQRRIVALLRSEGFLATKVLRGLVQRLSEYLFDFLRYRDVERAKIGWAADKNLLNRKHVLLDLHKGGAPSRRAWALAQQDLSESEISRLLAHGEPLQSHR